MNIFCENLTKFNMLKCLLMNVLFIGLVLNVIYADSEFELEIKMSQIMDKFIAETCGAEDLQNDFYQNICSKYTFFLKNSYQNRANKILIDEINTLDDEFPLEQLTGHFNMIKILSLMYLGDFNSFYKMQDFLKYEHNTYCAYFKKCQMHLSIIALGSYASYIHHKNLGIVDFYNELETHKNSVSAQELQQFQQIYSQITKCDFMSNIANQ